MKLPPIGSGVHLDIRVLLVEDVPVIARIVERMLTNSTHCKYHIEWRKTLADALAALRERDFDTVLLDLNLPDSDELNTLASVLEIARGVPVVVLTATEDEHIGLKAVQAGAQDYLVKGQCSGPELDRSIVYSIERHRLQYALRQLAVLDELTGLYNRRGFNTLNPELMQQLRRGTADGYIVCFDLDRFKQINDTQGHACGDAALVEFATHLRSAFRKQGLFARLGGDEFLAMGIESHPGAALESIAALEQILAERNSTGTSPFRLETSAGLLLLASDERRSLEELLAAADAALYRNKEARRAGRPVEHPRAPRRDETVPIAPRFDEPWQEIIQRLRAAAEAFDPGLAVHHDQVAATAAVIATRLGLPADRVERIRIAASVHDIGKIGVPRKILHWRGHLGTKALAIVRAHTEIGYRLLEGSAWPEIRCAADVALCHHEHWDGGGYPRGLWGESIPLEARIVAIADVFDALRSQRAYKEAWTDERVIAEMTSIRGTHFDPEIFDVFLASVVKVDGAVLGGVVPNSEPPPAACLTAATPENRPPDSATAAS
jgi:diguanylate cyclase (GGDEF)-like protein